MPIGQLQKQVAQSEVVRAKHVGGLDHDWLHRNNELQSNEVHGPLEWLWANQDDCRTAHPAILWGVVELVQNDVTWRRAMDGAQAIALLASQDDGSREVQGRKVTFHLQQLESSDSMKSFHNPHFVVSLFWNQQ